jgi:hypothetical protein
VFLLITGSHWKFLILQAAKKVASGKFAMASVGNISGVPFADQLK